LALNRCQKRLLFIWYTGSILPLVFLVGQILAGSFLVQQPDGTTESKAREAVGFWLSAMMPILSLVTGVAAANAINKESKIQKVDRAFFWFVFALSFFYLAIVHVVFLFIPFSRLSPLGVMREANLVLAPMQGLVSAALGGLFVLSKK
jgi:hypothetical protein